MSQIQIIEYSARSIVVAGDTMSIKKDLMNLGGKWNSKLKSPPGKGWVFPKTKQEEVEIFLCSIPPLLPHHPNKHYKRSSHSNANASNETPRKSVHDEVSDEQIENLTDKVSDVIMTNLLFQKDQIIAQKDKQIENLNQKISSLEKELIKKID